MPSTLEEQLHPFPLLGGLTAIELWPSTFLIVYAWFLLAFLPRWKHTMILTLIPPLVHSVIYVLSVFSLILYPAKEPEGQQDFTKFDVVVGLFRDPNFVFVGWFHYLVFDLLIGRWIVEDSIRRGSSCRGCTFPLFYLLTGSNWLALVHDFAIDLSVNQAPQEQTIIE